MHGRRCWKRGHDRGRADLEHHVGYQLPGQFVEEGMAERGKLDGQSIDVTTQAAVLDVGLVCRRCRKLKR